MGVYLKRRVKEGWKATERGRYGDCLVVKFCNKDNDKEMFDYAMYLKDIDFWLETIEDLKLLDELHKATINHIEKINTTQTTKEWSNDCFKTGLEVQKEDEKKKK